jgi:short-chain fatty acids transporter
MIRSMGNTFFKLSQRLMPNPMIFAIILTMISFLLGLSMTDSGVMDMIRHWYAGFWNLLAFSMQMVLILVTGHALAVAPGIGRLIQRLANWPTDNARAAALTALVACVFSWLNWGLGLIVGALFALEVGKQAYKRGVKVHYPLIVAAGYSGQMVWHLGPSSSSGLTSATPGHFLEETIGIVPITLTAFSGYALLNGILLALFVVPLIFYLMAPKREDSLGIDDYVPHLLEPNEGENLDSHRPERHLADKLENSQLLVAAVASMALSHIGYHFYAKGFDLDLNIVNFTFLTLGLLLHQTPARYIQAVDEAAKGASGIILQYPFYGGIMGMISFSGLGAITAGWLLTLATPSNLPVITWLSAGLLNIFVPSGGGEWSILGPILANLTEQLQVPIGKVIVAFGAGDGWTNMLQPFWAIALLGITGLKARHIMGYCMVLLLFSVPFFVLGLTFFPY